MTDGQQVQAVCLLVVVVAGTQQGQGPLGQLYGILIALAGIFAKRPSVAGAGFMTAAHTKTSSDFSRVRRIKAYPRLHSIKVNEGLSKNQVYTHPEDFSFVLDYIQSHCPKCSKK